MLTETSMCADLISEKVCLEKQLVANTVQRHQIEGALQMVQHLLGKLKQREEQPFPSRNGLPPSDTVQETS